MAFIVPYTTGVLLKGYSQKCLSKGEVINLDQVTIAFTVVLKSSEFGFMLLHWYYLLKDGGIIEAKD